MNKNLSQGSSLVVVVKVPGVGIITGGKIRLGSRGNVFSAPLALLLKPRLEPYNVTCSATSLDGHATYTDSTLVKYLPPNPYGGSTVKMDLQSGGLVARRKGESQYQPIVPYGFYTSFSDYLAKNLSTLNDIKDLG